MYTNQEWALDVARRNQAYKEAARQASLDSNRRPIQQIVKMNAASTLDPIRICGYVQDIVEKRGAKLVRQKGALGQRLISKALGHRETQLTIITSNFESYTAFADVSQTVLARGSTVVAVLKPTDIVGLGTVFVCQDLDALPIRPHAAANG